MLLGCCTSLCAEDNGNMGLSGGNTLVYTDPYMASLNPASEMNILWLVKEECKGYVEYGTTLSMGKRADAVLYKIDGFRTSATPAGYDAVPENNPELPVYQLIADIKGLDAGTVVYYHVTTVKDGREQKGGRYFFKAAPKNRGEFNFALLSDMQLKVKTKETVKFLGQQEKDFILFAGDMCNTPWKAGEWINVDGCYEVPSEADRGF